MSITHCVRCGGHEEYWEKVNPREPVGTQPRTTKQAPFSSVLPCATLNKLPGTNSEYTHYQRVLEFQFWHLWEVTLACLNAFAKFELDFCEQIQHLNIIYVTYSPSFTVIVVFLIKTGPHSLGRLLARTASKEGEMLVMAEATSKNALSPSMLCL